MQGGYDDSGDDDNDYDGYIETAFEDRYIPSPTELANSGITEYNGSNVGGLLSLVLLDYINTRIITSKKQCPQPKTDSTARSS